MEAKLHTEEICCFLSKHTNTDPDCVAFPGLFCSLNEQAAFKMMKLSCVNLWYDNEDVNMFLH